MTRSKHKTWLFIVILASSIPVFGLPSTQASEEQTTNSSHPPALAAEVENGLSYLIDLAQQPKSVFDPNRVQSLLEFAVAEDASARSADPAERASGFGVYLRSDIQAPLERILRYAFNPRIPSYVIIPKQLRLSGRYPESDLVTRDIKLWESLSTIDKPLVLRGREYEVTTPDTSTGGYYRYDQDRLIILLHHRGSPLLISVSKMTRPSDVGKRAVIVDDPNWTYFYSGQKGLSPAIIKWMDTFIYDTCSVMIFRPTGDNRRATNVTLFKWLNAGWLGMNVVKPGHIRAGSERFIENLKYVMESELMPDAGTLAQKYNQTRTLPDENLDPLIKNYARNFEQYAMKHKELSEDRFSRLIRNGGYARILNREERVGVLMLEFLKSQFGKQPLIDFDLADSNDEDLVSNRIAKNAIPKSNMR
ncbi:MAG: hypothetical protein PVG62_03040 [Desulfobacterales bacterium]|jgi:hypothetical protein